MAREDAVHGLNKYPLVRKHASRIRKAILVDVFIVCLSPSRRMQEKLIQGNMQLSLPHDL